MAAALAQRGGNSTLAAPRYAWAVGTQAFCLGTAAIYTAPNLTGPWSFAGNLLNQLRLDSRLNGQCEAPPHAPAPGDVGKQLVPQSSGPAYGGPCWQFGSKCRMWEVVDFTTVAPGVYVAKVRGLAIGRRDRTPRPRGRAGGRVGTSPLSSPPFLIP